MTKKIFAMFLAVLMVISLLPTSVFAADEKTCPGKDNHTLDNCSYTVVKVTEPTCGTIGYTSYKCDKCGEIFIESRVPATGKHSMVAGEAKAPTCGEAGHEAGTKCENCGYEVPGKEIPALKPGTTCEWVDQTPTIDCTTGGTKTWKCAACGATKTEKIKAGEHTYGDPVVVTAPTATANGLAKATCTKCGDVKEVTVFYTHKHLNITHAEVPATCTIPGVKEYKECRICGEKKIMNSKGSWVAIENEADLIIPAEHKFAKEPTCVDTVLTCKYCNKDIAVDTRDLHEFKTWITQKDATCTSTGYAISTCAVCNIAVSTKILEAKGHLSATVSVPATCGTYAYSFTYCTRKDCKNGISSAVLDSKFNARYDLTVDAFDPINTLPTVGKAFYLGMNTDKIGEVFFTGEMDGYYFGTSHDVSKAALVYVEYAHCEHEPTYNLYFYDAEGVKTYLEIYEYNTEKHSVGVRMTTQASANAFKWDDVNGMFTCDVTTSNKKTNTYFLGTGKDFTNISAKKLSDLSKSSAAVFCNVGTKVRPVNIVAYTLSDNAGYDTNNHKLTKHVIVEATCQQQGQTLLVCEYCAYNTTITVAAEHNWVNVPYATTGYGADKKEASYKAPCCEDGWQYQQCTGCKETRKVTLAGKGHVWGEIVTGKPDHINTVAYDTRTCSCCKTVEKLTPRVWADANKQWDSLEAAIVAHPGLNQSTMYTLLKGDCNTAALYRYTCADCGKYVYVKYTGAGCGQHVLPDTANYTPSTCYSEGGFYTKKCEKCGQIVGDAALDEWNTIPKKEHTWVENKDYKPADCDKPNYDNVVRTCSVCKLKETDGTKLLGKKTSNATDLCVKTTYEYYLCHCGKEHMISYAEKKGHTFNEVAHTKDNYLAPTCYDAGFYTVKCVYCGVEEIRELAPIEHVNADGQKFTDKCTDTITDRHCVVCCAHYNHKDLGSKHDCANTKNDKGELTCPCMIAKKCHLSINTLKPSTCTMNAHTLKVCADCGKETVVFVDGAASTGHMPAEADKDKDGNYIFYKNYTYKEITYIAWDVVNGEFVKIEKTYTAKFTEYVESTYVSDGYWKAYCQECDKEVTQVIEKKAGLGFEMDIVNAANNGNEFTYGSLVAVTVNANSLNTGIYSFNFNVNYTNMVFVGYETVNDNFILTVTEPSKVSGNNVYIVGFATNDASGKMQNVTITENTQLVKLYFRCVEQNASTATFAFGTEYKEAYSIEGVNTKKPLACSYATETIKTRALLDFNGDGFTHITDVYQAMSMLTGEQADGKTYDVTMDVNKDGVITLEDLSYVYGMFVGNYTAKDLLLLNVSAEEALLLGLGETTHCNNSACQKEISADATYCPFCGNHQ